MTVVQPNSIAGINSISVQSGQSLSIHKSDGTLIREIVASTGISTFSSISVGSAATANNAGKSINIGLGASISQHADNTLSFGTNGIVRARITSAGNIGVGNDASFPIYTDSGDRTLILGSGSDDAAIQLHSGTDKFGGLYFGDATSGGARYQGYVEYKHDDDYLRFATGGTEKLRIISSGLVGINNDSPATVLDIKSTKNSDGLTVTKASNVAAFLGHNGSGDEGLLHLKDGGTTTIQIYGETGQASFFNAGKVGVGTAAPAQTIHLSAASGDVYNRVDTNVNGGMLLYVQGTQRSIFANDSAFSGTITDTGIGAKGNMIFRAGTSSYDERLRITSAGKIQVTGTRGGALQPEDDDTLQLYTAASDNSINRGSGITFYNHDNSGYEQGGTIQVAKENGTADNEAAYMRFNVRPAGATNVERLRITSTGAISFNNGELVERCYIQSSPAWSSNGAVDLDNGVVQYNTTNYGSGGAGSLYFTSSVGINTQMSTGDIMSLTMMTNVNSTAGYINNIFIDGQAATETWVGGSAPTAGGGSGVDIYTFNIIKTASATYTVIANQVLTSS